jgi:hypothetical protein
VDAETNEKAAVMDSARKTDFKTKLAGLYSAEVVAYVTTLKDDPEVIAQALKECQLRPPWKVGADVKIGEIYAYGNSLYRCVQAHRTQADWTPDRTPALWVVFYELSAGPQPWKQPAGAHDAYALGAKVTHKSRTWESLYAANVWEPGVFGWKDIGAAVIKA